MVHCGFDLCESKMVQFQNWIRCLFLHPIPLEREAVDVNFAVHFLLLDRFFCNHYLPTGAWPKS